jgi:glycosyltransferase involved in cell wall biosynthesis
VTTSNEEHTQVSNFPVVHFGPDPAYVGGVASVLRIMRARSLGGRVRLASTWVPTSRRAQARLFARALVTVARLPKDAVVHAHVTERGSLLRKGAILRFARRRGLTTVTTVHGADFVAGAHRDPRWTIAALSGVDLAICLAPEAQQVFADIMPQTPSVLLPNPIEVAHDGSPADATEPVVLFAGEIGTRKGADVLSEAWSIVAAAMPEARCIMVGPATDFVVPERERLEVRPPADAAAIANLLQQARVVVLPSRAEAMPMALLEAMAAGRPFVSTPVGAIPELAAYGGKLVPVGDAEALAEALLVFLRDPAAAKEAGETARRFCVDTRDVAHIDRRLRQLYLDARRHRQSN